MDSNRRTFLKFSFISLGAIGLAGCSLLDESPNITFSENLYTDEPVVEDVNLSEFYPTEYSAKLHSGNSGTIRPSYVERNVQPLYNAFSDADFSSESIVIFGKYMPRNVRLDLKEASGDNGEIVFPYEIIETESSQTEMAINTQILTIDKNVKDTQIIHNIEY